MPLIGFGTYQVKSPNVLKQAIEAGYRMFDTASFYDNEWLVGDCLSRSNVDGLFVVSKAWNDIVYDGPAAIRYQIAKSLQDLRVDCIDLYMIHWPVPGKFVAVYNVLEEMHKQGKIRDIGLSNFTIEDYEELIDSGISVLPSVIQLEVNPSLFRSKTIDYFKHKGLHIMSYRGFAKSKGLDDPDVIELGLKYNRSPSQILGRFLVQQHISHIPKSNDRERMVLNKDIFDFELEEIDMSLLKLKTTQADLLAFSEHYYSRRVKDTHMEFRPPKRTPITID